MQPTLYVDETKAKSYLLAVITCAPDREQRARKELGSLVLPGQRGLHMKDESDRRRRQIADTICGLGVEATIYDAGRSGTERERRLRCLRALIEDAARYRSAHLVFDLDETTVRWDRQQLIELTRQLGVKGRISYSHLDRHHDRLLAMPDAIAWSWAKGGYWRQRVQVITTQVRSV